MAIWSLLKRSSEPLSLLRVLFYSNVGHHKGIVFRRAPFRFLISRSENCRTIRNMASSSKASNEGNKAGQTVETDESEETKPSNENLGQGYDEHYSNATISALTRKNDLEGALKILNEMKVRGLKLSGWTFNPIIFLYTKRGNMTAAEKMLEQMKEAGVEPDFVTYNSLLQGYTHDIVNAERIFKIIQDNGFKLDQFTYRNMITARCNAGHIVQAVNLLAEMVQKGVEISAAAMDPIISTIAQYANLDLVLKVLKQMHERGLPVVSAYGSLVEQSKNRVDREYLDKIVEHMRSLRIHKDLRLYRAIVVAYAAIPSSIDVQRVMAEMQEDGVRIDNMVETSLLTAYCREGNVTEAKQVYSNLCKQHNVPKEAYSAIIQACSVANDVEGAEIVIRDVMKKELPLDSNTAVSFITMCNYGQHSRHLKWMSTNLAALQVDKNPLVLEALMTAFSSQSDWEKSWQVYKSAAIDFRNTGHAKPTATMFELAMKGAAERVDVPGAMVILNDMISANPTTPISQRIIRSIYDLYLNHASEVPAFSTAKLLDSCKIPLTSAMFDYLKKLQGNIASPLDVEQLQSFRKSKGIVNQWEKIEAQLAELATSLAGVEEVRERANKLLQQFAEGDLASGSATLYSSFARAFYSSPQHLNTLLTVMLEKEGSTISLTTAPLENLIASYMESGLVKEAEQALKKWISAEHANSVSFNSIMTKSFFSALKNCETKHNSNLARKLLEVAKNLRVQITPEMYSCALKAHMMTPDYLEADQLVREIACSGLMTDELRTFQNVVDK